MAIWDKLKRLPRDYFRAANTFSPLGLIGKLRTGQNITELPSDDSINQGFQTALGVGNGWLSNALSGFSGTVNFGQNQKRANIVFWVIVAVVIIFIWPGLLVSKR